MVSVPLRDVTSRMSVMYACNAAHLRKRRKRRRTTTKGDNVSHRHRELIGGVFYFYFIFLARPASSKGVKSDTAVYTAGGCSLA